MQRRKRRDGIWQWSSESLHAVAGSLRKKGWAVDLSEQQTWLWEAVISELEFRHRRPKQFGPRCGCEFCAGPFLGVSVDEALVVDPGANGPLPRSVYRIVAESIPEGAAPT